LTIKRPKSRFCWSAFPPLDRINAGISLSVDAVHQQEFKRDTAFPAFVLQPDDE
jgi:hypothetical protein